MTSIRIELRLTELKNITKELNKAKDNVKLATKTFNENIRSRKNLKNKARKELDEANKKLTSKKEEYKIVLQKYKDSITTDIQTIEAIIFNPRATLVLNSGDTLTLF